MQESVRAGDIAMLLDSAPDGLTTLSLDCFDTLLWRNVQAPKDVFAELPIPGGGIEPRMAAEGGARAARLQRDGLNEVSIEQIYERLMPHAAPGERIAAIARELAAEARHCFAFAPVVALMRAARAKGLQVAIVSDTYLSAAQLRALIAAAGGADVAALIDHVFVSSEHGLSKGQGLFRPVLEQLGVAPWSILHLGDNPDADARAPRALGIRAVHFEQFTETAAQRLRLEAVAAAMIETRTRISLPVVQPHRPQLSLRAVADTAAALGHDVLGPVMHSFATWVRDEADALAAAHGRPVRILFLLRDGHLPHRAFLAAGLGDAAAIEISRFTATRASFRDEAAIRAYLLDEPTERVEVLGRQLLLEESEIAGLGRDSARFREKVVDPSWVKRIRKRSAEFARRLVAHVRGAGVDAGDIVMLVDLGYNGTVENLVTPVLVEGLGVRVAGRYLLLRERTPSGLDKRGLLDVRHYETRTLNGLCRSIAVVEQLATVSQGSVVDYHPNGKPIRKAGGVKSAQNATRDAVQAACLAFVREAGRGVHRPAASDDREARRRMAAAVLARLLFLPQSGEAALFEAFDHDVNLGTNDLVRMFDSEAASEGLRRRGAPYLASVDRMYLPGEIHAHGLPLALALFTVGRFGLDLRHADFRVAGLDVPVLLASDRGEAAITVQATPTHEGYHLLTVPVGTGEYAVGIQLGAIAEWVQIDEVAIHEVALFADDKQASRGRAVTPIYDAMDQVAPGLARCADNGLLFVPALGPALGRSPGPALLLAVVFRPVVRRAEASLQKMVA